VAAASYSDAKNEIDSLRLELSAITQKEAQSSSSAIQARLDVEKLQSELRSHKARIVELESAGDPQFDDFRTQVSDIFQRHVLSAHYQAHVTTGGSASVRAPSVLLPTTALPETSEIATLRSRLASSEVSQVSLASQLAESDAFVQCVRQSVLQLEKQVAKLKLKLKAAIANESAATARAHGSECREKDAVAIAKKLSIEISALHAKYEHKRAVNDTLPPQPVDSERRVAALEFGMQALMDESSRALESALAIAMREGSARAVLADEVQLLRRVSEQPASFVDVEPSVLTVLSSSVPALLRRRILFSRQILCKAAVCRTQLFGFQNELSSLASAWRCNVAALQRETASALLAAVAAAQNCKGSRTR
jgi:chromosome segregation ATPase